MEKKIMTEFNTLTFFWKSWNKFNALTFFEKKDWIQCTSSFYGIEGIDFNNLTFLLEKKDWIYYTIFSFWKKRIE